MKCAVSLPELHDVLPQLLHRVLCLDVGISIKAGGKGVYDAELVQGFCMGLQPLIAASYCLCTLQPAHTHRLQLPPQYRIRGEVGNCFLSFMPQYEHRCQQGMKPLQPAFT